MDASSAEKVSNLWLSISRGDFDRETLDGDTDKLEKSQNKINLIPNYVQKQIVAFIADKLEAPHLTIAALDKMEKLKDNACFEKMLCSIGGLDPRCANLHV